LEAPVAPEEMPLVLPVALALSDEVEVPELATAPLVLEDEVVALPALAKPLVLPVALSELLELDAADEVAPVLALFEEASLLAIALLVDGVEDDAPAEEVSVEAELELAKPLVLPVELRELLELEEGEEAAPVLVLLVELSLLATELPVEGVDDEMPADEVSVDAEFELAKPLVLPVELSELLELEEGEEDAPVLLLFAELSLLATELLELLVEGVEDDAPADEESVEAEFELAKPLVLPVALSELLELEEGEELAEFDRLELLLLLWSLLAIELLVDGVVDDEEVEAEPVLATPLVLADIDEDELLSEA
jgi:hypothetical protein